MALWPFRRKGLRKRSPGGRGRETGDPNAPSRAMTEPAIATGASPGGPVASLERMSRKNTKRDSSGSRKLQRRGRTYSFSPGRPDSIRIARAREESVPPLPAGPIPVSANDDYGNKGNGPWDESKETEIRDRVPTLHHNNSRNKRRGQPLPRRKSSKRRKEDYDREAEIKAMSLPMPVRPATDSWTAGRPMKKDSKRIRTGLTKDWHRPDSDISLPIAESLSSTMSSDSEYASFRVSAFAALTPRPTLRYASNPVYGASSTSGPIRSTSQKRKFSERRPIPEETLKAHKRIDDLADELDASDLRELMDRDKRRRDRKKEKERERIERRLARRAERQRAEEAEAERNGTPLPPNLERGVMGRESTSLGVDTISAVVTSSRRRSSLESPRKREKRPAGVDNQSPRERAPTPLDKFHRIDSMPLEPATSVQAPEPESKYESELPALAQEPEPRSSRSPSPRLLGFIRSKKRRSKASLQTDTPNIEEKPISPASTRVVSESESGGRRSDSGSSSRPWISIFKWGRNSKTRRSPEPSSFSNASRDSMPTSHPPTQPQPISYTSVQRSNSKVPKRTMSRFREDLPELPLSPPDSRVASPEAEHQHTEPLPVIADDVAMRYDTPTSGHRATPSSMHRDDQTSPAPHSMSLASIDSEGSWLSGRVNRKRASSGMHGSLMSYPLRSVSGESEEHDDDRIADDEFLKTVVDHRQYRNSSGEAQPSSDEEDEREDDDEKSPKWGNVGLTPTVMVNRDTMRSREGLLQTFDDDDDEKDDHGKNSDDDSSVQIDLSEAPQRATSISFRKGQQHVRNFSAGSAKLLEISPRASADRRRSTNEPITQ